MLKRLYDKGVVDVGGNILMSLRGVAARDERGGKCASRGWMW
jgi:hypothetical protein